jgi:hypothetical protein
VLLAAGWQWVRVAQVFGVVPLKTVWAVLRLAWKSYRQGSLLTIATASLLFDLADLISGWGYPIPKYFSIALAAAVISHYSTPPAVLLLAASRRESVRLVVELSVRLFPLRVAQLLDPGISSSFDDKLGFEDAGFRTWSDWRRAVDALRQIARVIVLDTRIDTHPVREEARLLLTDPMSHTKAVFVGHPSGRCPVLEALPTVPPLATLRIVEEKNVVPLVARLIANPQATSSPTPQRPFSDHEGGFSLVIPAGWRTGHTSEEFRYHGGRATFSADGGGTLNISCGDPDPGTPTDYEDRTSDAREFLSRITPATGYSIVARSGDVAGERNVAWVEAGWQGHFHGILSIIHQGLEYVIQYQGTARHRADIEAIVASFHFDGPPRASIN